MPVLLVPGDGPEVHCKWMAQAPGATFFFHPCADGKINLIPIFRQNLCPTCEFNPTKRSPGELQSMSLTYNRRPRFTWTLRGGRPQDKVKWRVPALQPIYPFLARPFSTSQFFLDDVSKQGTRKTWQLDHSGCSLCIALTSPVWCSPESGAWQNCLSLQLLLALTLPFTEATRTRPPRESEWGAGWPLGTRAPSSATQSKPGRSSGHGLQS